MKIIDVLRTAVSEHEIRFLLTAYVEAVRYGSSGDSTEAAYALPLGDVDDLQARIAAFESAPAQPSQSENESARAIARDAATVFRVALQRLHALGIEERRRARVAA